MSVENIKAFSIIGLEENLDKVVDILGDSGVFHPDDISNFYTDTKGFTHIAASNKFSESLSAIQNTMNLLNIKEEYVSIKGFKPEFEEIQSIISDICKQVETLTSNKKQANLNLNECIRGIEEAKHFISIDYNIQEILNLKYIKAVFGRIQKNNLKKLNRYKDVLVEFLPASEENDYIWGVFFAPVTIDDTFERIISRLHFEPSVFSDFNDTPKNKLNELKNSLETYKSECDKIQKEINDFIEKHKNSILKYYTKLSQWNLFNNIRTKAMMKGNSFCIVGWIPTKNAKSVKGKLKKVESVEVYVANGNYELDLSPPVKLTNSFLTRPFKFYTEMYGVPKYNEIDPTPFIAFTYVLLFGIMFGDIGHGLLLSIAGFIMWKMKNMEIGKILVPCGLSGAFFGLIFGSVFGFEHALDGMYKAIGFDEKPIHVMAPSMTNTIIYAAVGIGMALLCIAMCLNIYSSFKQKNYGKAIFDTSGIFGLIFYGLICAGLVGLLIFGVNLFSPLYITLIVISFILVFLREPLGELVNGKSNWLPEKIGGFIIENLFESIEVLLSYVTNTMSFLRVGAFVLVHAGMMEVVFTLAGTTSGVAYWIIFVIGNIIVCVLEALLVAIQVLRLEYYEMFSRFYSGEGRPYEPVKLKITKN